MQGTQTGWRNLGGHWPAPACARPSRGSEPRGEQESLAPALLACLSASGSILCRVTPAAALVGPLHGLPPGCDASCLRPSVSTTHLGSDEAGTPVCVCRWGQEEPLVSAKGLTLSGRKLTEPDPASGSSTPPRTRGPVPLHQTHPAFFTHRPAPEPSR